MSVYLSVCVCVHIRALAREHTHTLARVRISVNMMPLLMAFIRWRTTIAPPNAPCSVPNLLSWE